MEDMTSSEDLSTSIETAKKKKTVMEEALLRDLSFITEQNTKTVATNEDTTNNMDEPFEKTKETTKKRETSKMDEALVRDLHVAFPSEPEGTEESLVERIIRILCHEGVLGKNDWESLEPDFQTMVLGVLREQGKLSISDLQRVKRALEETTNETRSLTRKTTAVPRNGKDSFRDEEVGNANGEKQVHLKKSDFFFEFSVKRNPLDGLLPVHHRIYWYEATAHALADEPSRLRDALLNKCEMYVIFASLIISEMIGLFVGNITLNSAIDGVIWFVVVALFFSALLVLGIYLIGLTQISAISDANLVIWVKANITMFTFGGKVVVSALVLLVTLVGCLVWRFVSLASEDVPAGLRYLPGVGFAVLAPACINLLFFHVNVGSRSIVETGCLRNNPIVSTDEVRDMTPQEAGDALFSRGFDKEWEAEHSFRGPNNQGPRRRHMLGPKFVPIF